ncbi:Stonustoxin subunit beta [Labeo rohita]|uniref:Stonustoxin subunit beta n=1 Tax=Labeo rohita TaxID=84645 RepID=A0ABQ8LAB2_LABRO|nr:Stonustoxin subunit beta [Labeo rohita]
MCGKDHFAGVSLAWPAFYGCQSGSYCRSSRGSGNRQSMVEGSLCWRGVTIGYYKVESGHRGTQLSVDHGGESRITAGLKKYACFLTLDPNTVNTRLILSEENRKVTRGYQWYPDHPDRFNEWYQVLCRESVCGRCYWEIEWSGDYGVSISVSYKSISRKGWGDECLFGYNDQSWSLSCFPDSYSFRHNTIQTDLTVKPISSRRIGVYGNIYRIGVYVDVSAGTLSFYSIYRNTVSLIHTEQTTFTQPFYPGFYVGYKSSVKLC